MTAPRGVLAFRPTGALPASAARVLDAHAAPDDRVLEDAMSRAETPTTHPLVGFMGPVKLSFVAEVARCIEADGRPVRVEWLRDERGIIDGLAIVEHVR